MRHWPGGWTSRWARGLPRPPWGDRSSSSGGVWKAQVGSCCRTAPGEGVSGDLVPEFWERVEECGVWSAHPYFHRTTGGNGAEDKPTVTMVRTTTGISPLGLRAGLLHAPDRTRSCLARPHGAPRGSGEWAQDTDKDTEGQEGKRLALGHQSGWQPGRGPWPGAHPLAPAPTSQFRHM